MKCAFEEMWNNLKTLIVCEKEKYEYLPNTVEYYDGLEWVQERMGDLEESGDIKAVDE